MTGPVQNVNRSSLFLGGVAATTAPGYAAASPGTGYRAAERVERGLSIFRRDLRADGGATGRERRRGRGSRGQQQHDAAKWPKRISIFSRPAVCLRSPARPSRNAKALSDITGSYARTGQGLEADHHRALTELNHRRKEMRLYTGQLLVASANLVRLLVLDPQSVIAPIEPAEAIINLIPDDVPLDELVVRGLRNRPELAGAQELVEATLLRFKQAKLRPFVPSLAVSYAGGGFGGGPGSFFGDFGARGDVAASLFWELQNLGFGDWRSFAAAGSRIERRASRQIKVEAQVAADVVAAYETKQAAALQIKRIARDRGRGARIAEAQHDQHSPCRRIAACDAADRSPSADPGAGPGAKRLSRLGLGLQPGAIPAEPGDRRARGDLGRQEPVAHSCAGSCGPRVVGAVSEVAGS